MSQHLRIKWVAPVKVQLNDELIMYSIPPPGSGVLTAYILNILDAFLLQDSTGKDPLTYHRIAEAFKYAYAQRTKLADPDFAPEVEEVQFELPTIKRLTSAILIFHFSVSQLARNLTSEALAAETRAKINDSFTSNDPQYYGAVTYTPDDKGTSHVSVLDGEGLAVSVTSTINLQWEFKNEIAFIFKQKHCEILFNTCQFWSRFRLGADGYHHERWDGRFFVSQCHQLLRTASKPSKFYPTRQASPLVYDADDHRQLDIRPSAFRHRCRWRDQNNYIHCLCNYKNWTNNEYLVLPSSSSSNKMFLLSLFSRGKAIIRNLWFGETIKEAVDSDRIHHQLFPMELQHEPGFPTVRYLLIQFIAIINNNNWHSVIQTILDSLAEKGHNFSTFSNSSAVCGIVVEPSDGFIYANSDYRKGGDVAGIDPLD